LLVLAGKLHGKQILGMFPITNTFFYEKTFRISGRLGKVLYGSHAHVVDQFLHPFRAGFAHFVNNMAVFIQCESSGVVSHVFLQGLDVIASLDAVYSKCMAEIIWKF